MHQRLRAIDGLACIIILTSLWTGCDAGAGLDISPGVDTLVGDSGADSSTNVTEDVPVTPPSGADTLVDTSLDDIGEVLSDLGSENPCSEGGGCFGSPCTDNADCFSGLCMFHMGETVCSKHCDETCPAGWRCAQIATPGADVSFACVSLASHLCLPCHTSDDCDPQLSLAACVDHGEVGRFCGAPCDAATPCPDGFACEERQTADGGSSAQCVPEGQATCECTQAAISLGLTTPCFSTNAHGTCLGTRGCQGEGLTECDAPPPAAELCDGIDNDCDGETDEGTCDDDNPCTQDWCNAQVGCEHEPLVDVACDDADACTFGDACLSGLCVGQPLVCQDGNPCTDDACDEVFGCLFTGNGDPCDDGDPCTLGDQCGESACQSGTPIQCDDQNPCTTDACADNGCAFVPNTAPCDDGDPCTTGDTCVAGACLSTATVTCDDDNPCTDDICSDEGCQHLPNDALCSDGDPCTVGDQCAAGSCVAGADPLNCADDNPCTDDACVAGEGCQSVANDAPCDDGNPCTFADTCDDGSCVAGQISSCDDGNLCTDDSCDPATGCVHAHNTNPCNDADPCTTLDLCHQGACVGAEPLVCADDNPCTDNLCIAGQGCVFPPNAQPCQDGNPCTTMDTCQGGFCAGLSALDCDDDNPCTDDTCDPTTGCVHTANESPCDDGDPCTLGDTCLGTLCVSAETMSCDDQNPCTEDICDPQLGCVFSPIDGPCDDSNACTLGDTCQEGVCVGQAPAICQDDNPCTDDGCDPQEGCLHPPNQNPCDDGDVCTSGDICQQGVCLPGDLMTCQDDNPCTDDSCDPQQGCVFSPNDDPCDDLNACTLGDTCQQGVCLPVDNTVCDDQNPCTQDWCDWASGCQHDPAPAPCDDGNLCTVGDQCEAGACAPGTPLACADDNPCTDDGCDPTGGCIYALNTADCNDGDACTQGDVCAGGECAGQPAPPCDDQNPCTEDSCDPASGCVHHPQEVGCDDGNACTESDQCVGTLCQGTAIAPCDDGDDCTSDSCDPAIGCTASPITPCCGNGILEPGEECDSQSGGCSDSCTSSMCYDDWYVGAPCNGTDYGNGCNTEITGYHFRGVFSGWACWWHTRNQAWNTSTSSNHYQLAQQFGLEASQGWCNWCFASGDVPTGMSQGGCGYLSSSNVGAWGWCAESVSDRGGWICFPDAGHPTCSGATSFPNFP